MALELNINGVVEMTIYDTHGTEVSESVEKIVLEALNKGEVFLGLDSKTISQLDGTIIYEVTFDVGDYMEYEFDNL